jgi:hypothetical protein
MEQFVVTHWDHGEQVYFVDFAGRNKSCGVTTTVKSGAKVFEHEINAREVVCELNSRKHYANSPWQVEKL